MGISAARVRAIRQADSARLQIAVQGFQQVRPANVVNEDAAATDLPPLGLHAVAVATDMHANHPLAKGLH